MFVPINRRTIILLLLPNKWIWGVFLVLRGPEYSIDSSLNKQEYKTNSAFLLG